MTAKQDTINELAAIFPQHNNLTIVHVYDDVVRNVGEENFVLVLPSCIEQLLDLPDDFEVPKVVPNVGIFDGFEEVYVNKIESKDLIIGNNLIQKTPEINESMKGKKLTAINVPGLVDSDDDTKSNDSKTSNDEIHNDLQSYRRRKRPIYREPAVDTSPASSMDSIGSALFPDDDDLFNSQEVMILEKQSTKRELVKHTIYDADDVIHVKTTSSSSTTVTPIHNDNMKRKHETEVDELNFIKNKHTKLDDKLINDNKTVKLVGDSEKFLDTNFPVNVVIKCKQSSANTIITGNKQNKVATPSGSSYAKNKSYTSVSSSTITSSAGKKSNGATGSSSTTSYEASDLLLDGAESATQVDKTPISNKIKTISSSSLNISGSSSTTKSKNVRRVSPKLVKEQDPSLLKRGMPGYFEHAHSQIKAVIQNVEDKYLEKLIQNQPVLSIPELVNSVVLYLLDWHMYPTVKKAKPISSEQNSSSSYDRYYPQAVTMLQNTFPQISTKVIRNVMSLNDDSYKACHVLFTNLLQQIQSGEKKVSETVIGSFMKGRRRSIELPLQLDPELAKELDCVQSDKKAESEKNDRNTAMALNLKQYEEEGQAIECGCCYGDAAFEDMIQCLEGHLFCVECLQRYSKEAVFGEGKVQLFCMTNGCDSTFPFSQMKKALPEMMMKKYYERVQDEDLKLANIDNLVRCPGCDFAAEMADGDKVFRCQNTECMQETCRYCQENWAQHFGLPCKEVEKKDVTNLRISYEEKMTQAKVRSCWQCKTIFLKSSGCNKMTCRCGAKMCYICRQQKIDYGHFCQHVREPGHGCTKCKKCSLWTDPTEDDDRAVAEIQKQAEEERKKLNGEDNGGIVILNQIGPKIDVKGKNKKQKEDNRLHGGVQNNAPPPQQFNIEIDRLHRERMLLLEERQQQLEDFQRLQHIRERQQYDAMNRQFDPQAIRHHANVRNDPETDSSDSDDGEYYGSSEGEDNSDYDDDNYEDVERNDDDSDSLSSDEDH